MRKVTLLASAVVLVSVVAWAAYSYAQGAGPFAGNRASCQRSACTPATQPCDRAAARHADGMACHDDCANCPDFKDQDKDGKCDVAGECRRADCTTCPAHTGPGCTGQAEANHAGHGKGGCGTHVGAGTGCWHGGH
jgi:hypothetical protein